MVMVGAGTGLKHTLEKRSRKNAMKLAIIDLRIYDYSFQ